MTPFEVKRSDGGWTYALVADGDETQIRFVVNGSGATKSIPSEFWRTSVRRIKVLTQREGDRIVHNEPGRKKRCIGRSRSFRQKRGNGKGRFVSPSPTRRNTGVVSIPPTIMEGKHYN